VVWGGLALAWQIFGWTQGSYLFPTFTSTVGAVPELWRDGVLTTYLVSLYDVAIGFGMAVVVGIFLGTLVGLSRWARWALKIYLDSLLVTSFAALLPFLIIVFGTDRQYRVAVVFLFSLMYITSTTTSGVQAVDAGHRDVARSFGASRRIRTMRVVLPSAAPYVLTGVRLALAQAIQGIIVAQLWVNVSTGRDLTNFGIRHDLPQFFALAVFVGLVGALLVHLVSVLQRRLTPWASDVGKVLGGGL
jgi:ABC-type nitrate/sulfonate/bicarbonate transport system permease component